MLNSVHSAGSVEMTARCGRDAISRFQTAAGLKPDGEVGPVTWTALIGDKRRVQVRTRAIQPEGADFDRAIQPKGDDFDFEDIDILAVLDGLPGE